MTDRKHKFKVGQTVDLVQSMSRSAASGHYEILSLRPAEAGNPQYRIKSRSESHERAVAETDLILSAHRSSMTKAAVASLHLCHAGRNELAMQRKEAGDDVQDP